MPKEKIRRKKLIKHLKRWGKEHPNSAKENRSSLKKHFTNVKIE